MLTRTFEIYIVIKCRLNQENNNNDDDDNQQTKKMNPVTTEKHLCILKTILMYFFFYDKYMILNIFHITLIHSYSVKYWIQLRRLIIVINVDLNFHNNQNR